MMKPVAILLIFGANVGALSSAHSATLEYWPLQKDNFWIYAGTQTTPRGVDFGLFKTDALGGPANAQVLHQYGAWVGDTRYTFDQSDGLNTLLTKAETTEGAQVFSPPLRHLPSDDSVGTQFSSAGSCGNAGGVICTYTQTGLIAAFEPVAVKAGTFNAMRVEYAIDITQKVGDGEVKTHIDDVIWMASGVGEVKRTIYQQNLGVPDAWFRDEIELVTSNLAPNKDEEVNCDSESQFADPIHVATGNSQQFATDYPATSRLSFARIYNSRGATRTDMGYGWRHGLDHRLSFFEATSPRTVAMQRADGRTVTFSEPTLGTSGPWSADGDVNDRLVARYSQIGSNKPIGWYYYPGCTKVESYDATGQLKSMSWADGRRINVGYSNDRTMSYTDVTSGRKLTFSRAKAQGSLITQVKDDSGLAIGYGYDDNTFDLKTVGVVGKEKLVYYYNEPQRTGGADLPHALTTLKGEDGLVYVKWTFDAQRRAGSSTMGTVGAVHRIAYTSPGVSTLTYPNGKIGNVQYTYVQNVPTVTNRDLPPIDFAAGGMKSRFFDANRNVRQHDDFNGHRRCSLFSQARNVEVARVEGLDNTIDCATVLVPNAPLPQGSRKISAQWHPDWRFRSRVAEPLKITSYVYNGETDPTTQKPASCVTPDTARLVDGKVLGVLCALIEQRTDDDSGAQGLDAAVKSPARVWRYAYNSDGQMTSTLDPVKSKTSYEYYAEASYPDGKRGHSKGDLMTVTNGAGHQTRFDLYDMAGRLLQMTDANQTKTELGYEAHGWLETAKMTPTEGGGAIQLTRYDYYPTGLLKTVTTPDGMAVSMLYDDARRLTDATDSAGNTVHYTPDEMGNPGVEELRSKDGKLARRVERIFNDLNRLKDLKVVAQRSGSLSK